jgi:hypothetical protein
MTVALGHWDPVANLTSARWGQGVAVLDNKIYTIAG